MRLDFSSLREGVEETLNKEAESSQTMPTIAPPLAARLEELKKNWNSQLAGKKPFTPEMERYFATAKANTTDPYRFWSKYQLATDRPEFDKRYAGAPPTEALQRFESSRSPENLKNTIFNPDKAIPSPSKYPFVDALKKSWNENALVRTARGVKDIGSGTAQTLEAAGQAARTVGQAAEDLTRTARDTHGFLRNFFGGDVAGPMLAVGGLIMMANLMAGKRSSGGDGGKSININIGGQGFTPFNTPGVNSLGDFGSKMASDKTADIVTDALTNAVRNRIANQVIDKVIREKSDAPTANDAEQKKLEIVTKYPEMEKLLENKENKAYLDRLLQA